VFADLHRRCSQIYTEGVRQFQPRVELWQPWDHECQLRETCNPERVARRDPTLFQTLVEIEIVTAGGTRVERVMIEPKEEQSFSFWMDLELGSSISTMAIRFSFIAFLLSFARGRIISAPETRIALTKVFRSQISSRS
jgi:hypothetical protein